MRFQEFVENQAFSPVLIADALRTTRSEIASTWVSVATRSLGLLESGHERLRCDCVRCWRF